MCNSLSKTLYILTTQCTHQPTTNLYQLDLKHQQYICLHLPLSLVLQSSPYKICSRGLSTKAVLQLGIKLSRGDIVGAGVSHLLKLFLQVSQGDIGPTLAAVPNTARFLRRDLPVIIDVKATKVGTDGFFGIHSSKLVGDRVQARGIGRQQSSSN